MPFLTADSEQHLVGLRNEDAGLRPEKRGEKRIRCSRVGIRPMTIMPSASSVLISSCARLQKIIGGRMNIASGIGRGFAGRQSDSARSISATRPRWVGSKRPQIAPKDLVCVDRVSTRQSQVQGERVISGIPVDRPERTRNRQSISVAFAGH